MPIPFEVRESLGLILRHVQAMQLHQDTINHLLERVVGHPEFGSSLGSTSLNGAELSSILNLPAQAPATLIGATTVPAKQAPAKQAPAKQAPAKRKSAKDKKAAKAKQASGQDDARNQSPVSGPLRVFLAEYLEKNDHVTAADLQALVERRTGAPAVRQRIHSLLYEMFKKKLLRRESTGQYTANTKQKQEIQALLTKETAERAAQAATA